MGLLGAIPLPAAELSWGRAECPALGIRLLSTLDGDDVDTNMSVCFIGCVMQHIPGATVNPFSAFTDSVLTNVLGASTSYAHLQGGGTETAGSSSPRFSPTATEGCGEGLNPHSLVLGPVRALSHDTGKLTSDVRIYAP